nr:protein FAM78B isoform X2 [Mirounga angustirostris]
MGCIQSITCKARIRRENIVVYDVCATIDQCPTRIEETSPIVLRYKTPYFKASARVVMPPIPRHETWVVGWIQACNQMEFFNTYSDLGIFSRPSLFGQMIGKRKKTHFWWQKDGHPSGSWEFWYCCSFPKAASGHHVSPADPSPSLGSGMLAGWNQRLTVPAEDRAAGSPAPGFRSEDLGSSASHVTFSRCLNNSVSALHARHWAMKSVLSPSLGGKDRERALRTEMCRARIIVIMMERDSCH